MKDSIYEKPSYKLSEIEHRYGQNVHILSDPFLLTHLAHLCSPQTHQPNVNQLLEAIYTHLTRVVVNMEFPRRAMQMPTRMVSSHPEAVLEGELIDYTSRAVSVSLARAGTIPSHICYMALNYILDPRYVRQDHIALNRAVNEEQQVVGTNVSGTKIGGPVKDAVVVVPDPMGATGGTVISALDIYKKQVEGPARKYIALHLIVTPEYLKRVTAAHPDLKIYALRLDRGLSTEKVLKSVPGTHWDEERGLNDNQYIIPGGGGFGEILNNSYV